MDVPAELAHESEVSAAEAGGEYLPVLEPDQPECRVLIVEDSPENAMVLEQMLTRAGFQVRVAENGALGVEAFEQWHPHFIWMDQQTPVMSGTEATRRIRKLEGGREVKIVAMTASVFASERDQMLTAGMDDFVRKPYRPAEVFACMGRLLGLRYRHIETLAATRAEPAGGLRLEALAALRPGLRRELTDAVLSLDSERILSAIAEVAEDDAELAAALKGLADRLEYTAVLNTIKRSEPDAVNSTTDGSEGVRP